MLPRTATVCALAAAAMVPLAAVAQTPEPLPTRKAGHWEVRMVTEKPAGGSEVVTQMCIDAATDREMMDFGLRMSKDACKRYDMKREGKSWVIDAECAFGPIKSVTHTIISGDFQSLVTVRIQGTTRGLPLPGAQQRPQETLMTQTSRWMGATCTDGLVPGDIAMPGGIKFNIRQMKGLKKLLPQLQVR